MLFNPHTLGSQPWSTREKNKQLHAVIRFLVTQIHFIIYSCTWKCLPSFLEFYASNEAWHQGPAWAFANVSNPWVRTWRLIPFWTWMQVTPRKKRDILYLTSPTTLSSPFPKWLFSPLSTQLADVYNIPLLIIKEDHLGERNSSLLLQSVQGRAGE